MKRSLVALLCLVPLLSRADLAGGALGQTPLGTLWVFAVGVSQYRNPALSLQFADNDASTLAAALQARASGVFREVKTRVLVNREATRSSILSEMRSFFAQARQEDAALIALMGHGVTMKGAYYFLPHPADLSNLTVEGLPLPAFEAGVKEVAQRVQRIVLAIDTCHAGALEIRVRGIRPPGGSAEERSRGAGLADGMAQRELETYVLSSSKETEESLEDANYRLPGEEKGHGAFTYALLRGLKGEAAPERHGTISVLDIFTYAARQVPKITAGRQNPFVRGEGTNFALAQAPPPQKPELIKQAIRLTEEGLRHEQRGDYAQAAASYQQAQTLNPQDEVPQLLAARLKDEQAYKADPQKQQAVAQEAKKLVEESGVPPASAAIATPVPLATTAPSVTPVPMATPSLAVPMPTPAATPAAAASPAAPDDPFADPRPMVVTFLDFETLGGGNEKAGLHEVLVQRVGQSLGGTKRVRVVERRLLDKVLEELKLSAGDLADPTTRLRVGRILAARLIGTGDVVFVGPTHLAFNLRMIDTETTELKINFSKDATDVEQVLAMADEIVSGVLGQIVREYPIRGKVVAVDPNEAILNIGTKHGVTPGMKLAAMVEEPVVVGGEVVAHRKREIATLEVTAAEEKASFARVLEAKGLVGEGVKVIERMPSGAAPAGSPAPAGAPPAAPLSPLEPAAPPSPVETPAVKSL